VLQRFNLHPEQTHEDILLRQVYRLRVLAWKADGVLPPSLVSGEESWQDAHDEHAIHWVVQSEGVVVAAARICIHQVLDQVPDAQLFIDSGMSPEPPLACFNRLVIAPTQRGRGLSGRLDSVRIVEAIRLNCKSAIAWTHNPRRIKPIQGLGFRLINYARHPTAEHLSRVAVFMLSF
jgi:hypothetical protein